MNTNRPNASSQSSSPTPGPQFKSDQLSALLSQLESCLESPIVPGELSSWASDVVKAHDVLRGPLCYEIQKTHPEQYTEISSEAPDLLRQVEQMQDEDGKLQKLFTAFGSKLREFRQQAEQVESQDSKLDQLVSELIDDGLGLVIRIRRQQQAIRTWLLESYQRDMGVAD